MGNRLRKLKERVKGLGEKGELTNVTIDKLKNYYGIIIRSNVGDLEGIKKATYASLFHVASSKETNLHLAYYPDGSKWPTKFKHGPGIPITIFGKHLKLIYQHLTSDTLLRKCLHGKRRNAME